MFFTRSTRRVIIALASAVALSGSVVACSSDDGGSTKTTLNVFAAASLKQTFEAIEKIYESKHSDVDVKLNPAGSSALVNQIQQGADADVIATADERTMAKLDGKVNAPMIFARNTLVIVTAAGNPKNIEKFADLTKAGVSTVVCAVEVPCGAATEQVEKNTGVTLAPKSEEASVTSVLTKVTSGEADAGLVYVTDAKSAGDKIAVVGDAAFAKVVNNYPIATLTASKHKQQAQDFVTLVLSAEGQKVLADAGFSAGN